MEQQKNNIERRLKMSRLIKYEVVNKDGKREFFETAIKVSNYLDISVSMVRTYVKSGKKIKGCTILRIEQKKKNLYFEKSAEWNQICEQLQSQTKKSLSDIKIICKNY